MSTLQAPSIPATAPAPAAPEQSPEPWTLRSFLRRYPWWGVGVLLVAISTALVYWARTSPGFDPYGWLIWGYQTLHGSLDLGGAPSWKPLPYLFTVPFALFGHYEFRLWMITAVTISLAASLFAGRIAYRLTGATAENRYAAWVAAVFAGGAALGIKTYMHYVLSVQSDPVIVTFCLAAIDFHLIGRRRWAFWMLVLASLGRPETWPFCGLYALWLWWRFPKMRLMVYAGLLLIPALWFGVPWITNGRPDVAGQLAQLSPNAVRGNKFTGVINRFFALHYLPVWIAAAASMALAVWRRDRLVLALGACCVVWVVVEIGFALHGWPAVPRYMFEPADVAATLGGVAVGWVLLDAPRLAGVITRIAGIALVAALVGWMVANAISELRIEHKDLKHERARTTEIRALNTAIGSLGGFRHIRDCGEPVTNVEYVSPLAWYTHMNVGRVGHRPDYELKQTYPIVLFTSLPDGWAVRPYRTPRALAASCRNLHAAYVFNSRHPGGALVPQ